MTTTFLELDVRPILRAGGEPFEKIMEAVNALEPGQGLRLLATFKPTPLLHVLGPKGFTHEMKALDGGDWEVLFSPSAAMGSGNGAPAPAATDSSRWPEAVQHLDNRDDECRRRPRLLSLRFQRPVEGGDRRRRCAHALSL